MLASPAARDNQWKGTIHKAHIINGNVTKYIIASLRLKDDLEGCRATPQVQFALQPIFACEKEINHLLDNLKAFNLGTNELCVLDTRTKLQQLQ